MTTEETLDQRYQVVAVERDGRWFAYVERPGGVRFGAEWSAGTETDARARVAAWLRWQKAHELALEALQDAERSYHRAIADGAFAGEEGDLAASRKAALERVEAARIRLDEVRAQQP